MIATGHHDVPRFPKIPGNFTGEIMHSRDYRSVKQLIDKRVVVVGAGNSACDIVVDATSVARAVYQSMRRGTYFVPKFMLGRPTDGIVNFCEKMPMPRGLRNLMYTLWHKLMVGSNARYGLPEPEHRIMDTHPTMNTVLPQLAAHGRIGIKPEITELKGRMVRFADGTEVEADLLVYATGYEIALPLIDNEPDLRCRRPPASLFQCVPSRARRSLRRRAHPGQWQHLAARRRPVEAGRELPRRRGGRP